jgi:chromosome segregation ATPase
MSEIFVEGERAIREIIEEKERLSAAISSLGDLIAATDPLKSVALEIHESLLKLEGSVSQLNTAISKVEHQQDAILDNMCQLLERHEAKILDEFVGFSEKLKAMEESLIAEMPVTFMGKRGGR